MLPFGSAQPRPFASTAPGCARWRLGGTLDAIDAQTCNSDHAIAAPARAAPIGTHAVDATSDDNEAAFSGVVTGFVDRRGFGFSV